MDVSSNLPSSRQQTVQKKKGLRVQGTTRRGSVGIFHLAFVFAVSWEPPYYLLVDASLPVIGRDSPKDGRWECLS